VPPNVTRPCAFVFLRAGDRVLVSEMQHPVEGTFYRHEELGVSIDDLALLGVREEIFTLDDEPYHEIDFIYEAWLTPGALAALDGVAIVEDDDDIEIARVVSVADLRAGRYVPLYPEGVLELLG
jgi:hypothetical protein